MEDSRIETKTRFKGRIETRYKFAPVGEGSVVSSDSTYDRHSRNEHSTLTRVVVKEVFLMHK